MPDQSRRACPFRVKDHGDLLFASKGQRPRFLAVLLFVCRQNATFVQRPRSSISSDQRWRTELRSLASTRSTSWRGSFHLSLEAAYAKIKEECTSLVQRSRCWAPSCSRLRQLMQQHVRYRYRHLNPPSASASSQTRPAVTVGLGASIARVGTARQRRLPNRAISSSARLSIQLGILLRRSQTR